MYTCEYGINNICIQTVDGTPGNYTVWPQSSWEVALEKLGQDSVQDPADLYLIMETGAYYIDPGSVWHPFWDEYLAGAGSVGATLLSGQSFWLPCETPDFMNARHSGGQNVCPDGGDRG